MKGAFIALAVGVGVLGNVALCQARLELPLSKKLAYAEYCYLIRVTNPDPRALTYEVKEVLRRRGVEGPLPRIELSGATPRQGTLYVVWATNNHRKDTTRPAEYRWSFFEVAEPEEGRRVIRQVDPDMSGASLGRRYFDMSFGEFKRMLEAYPFRD